MTLNDCLSLARQNNLEIKKSKLSIKESLYGKKNAFTKFFPTVNATVFGMSASAGLLETNLAGMDLSLIKKGFYGGMSLTQPIFLGGQINNANKLSNKLIGLQKTNTGIIVDKAEQLTEQYYWQYLQVKEKLKTIKTIEKLVIQTLKEVSLSVKAGLITHNNELQVKLRLNEVKSTKLQLQNNINTVKMLLAQHIRIPLDSLKIADVSSYILIHPSSFLVNYKTALNNNKTYSLLTKNTEITRYQTKIEKGKLLPSVGVGANYFFENMVDKNHTVGMAFVKISVPISNWWGGSYSVKQKAIKEQIAEFDKIDTGEKIMVQMHKHYNELEVAYLQVEITNQSVRSASENVRLNTNYYRTGLVTLNDLLEAQFLFQKAKDNQVDRYTEYLLKLSNYKKLIGK